jgi:aflatoxin B1 aldehyde reductase
VLTTISQIGDRSQDSTVRYDTPDEIHAYLNAFHAHGFNEVDTSRNYPPHAPGTSEARLGEMEASKRFTIDTKVNSKVPGSHNKAGILNSVDTSLATLKVPSVNVEYLHVPDRATPFAETLEAMNDAFTKGKFKKLGLSNFTVAEVEEVMTICEEKGWVKPSVYQGQYNAIVRSGEKELFPALRKYGIAFYAWRYGCPHSRVWLSGSR